jgi:hypothetical protein
MDNLDELKTYKKLNLENKYIYVICLLSTPQKSLIVEMDNVKN